jgi:hypothetical protein
MSGFVIQSLKARTAVTLNTNVEYERLTKVPACRSTGSEPICTLSVQLLKEDEEWQKQHRDVPDRLSAGRERASQSFIQAPLAPAVVNG